MGVAIAEDSSVGFEEVSAALGAEIVDEAARANLGMSGEEFKIAWESGGFDSDPDRPEVMRVAMLLPLLGG